MPRPLAMVRFSIQISSNELSFFCRQIYPHDIYDDKFMEKRLMKLLSNKYRLILLYQKKIVFRFEKLFFDFI